MTKPSFFALAAAVMFFLASNGAYAGSAGKGGAGGARTTSAPSSKVVVAPNANTSGSVVRDQRNSSKPMQNAHEMKKAIIGNFPR